MSETREQSDSPWYVRSKKALLGAGALASAALAVLSLWVWFFPRDTADVATIDSLVVSRQQSLSDFAAESTGQEFPLVPVEQSSETSGERVDAPLLLAAAGSANGSPTAIVTPAPAQTEEPSSEPTPADEPDPQPTEDPAPTPTDEPSPEPSPTDEPSPEPSPTEDPAPSPSETIELPMLRLSDSALVDVVARSDALEGYFMWNGTDGLPDETKDTNNTAVFYLVGAPVDTEDPDAELTADEMATRLAAALERVEVVGDRGALDPMGWAMVASLSLEGLKGVPLLLTWSLDGIDVPLTWRVDNIAYRVVATTAHDSGVGEIWIPALQGPGTYNANVKLVRESDGVVLAHAVQPIVQD